MSDLLESTLQQHFRSEKSDLLEIVFHIYERGQKIENFENFRKFQNFDSSTLRLGKATKHHQTVIGRQGPLLEGLPGIGSAELSPQNPRVWLAEKLADFRAAEMRRNDNFGRPTPTAENYAAQRRRPAGPAPARSSRHRKGGPRPSDHHLECCGTG